MMVIQPNVSPMGEAFSKDRIAPMVRDTPALRGKIADPKARTSGNTQLHKTFPGGHITIGGANSPAGLASRPIRFLAFDEIDRYEVTKEGHAVNLATKRTRTFHNRKILKVSSPTYENIGIDAEYSTADQCFEWHLVCPDCHGTQMPALRHFVWEKGKPDTAVYTCEHCGTAHDFDNEGRIKATGLWVQTKDIGHAKKAYWMNQWASPFARWGETIAEFLEAEKDPTKLQTVVNTAFAECWSKDQGDTVDADELYNRREDYQGIPTGVLAVVAGVDVQDDRVEVELIGYGKNFESWGLGYRVIWGDPGDAKLWQDLDDYLLTERQRNDGVPLPVAATCVDSGGHHTKDVYDYCRRRFHRRVFAIKGMAGWGRPVVSAPTQKKYGRGGNVRLFIVGVDEAKRIVHAHLEAEDGAGFCHYNQDYGHEYFDMLSAEELRTKYNKGAQVQYWHQTRARNESFDIRVYGYAAVVLLDPAWNKLEERYAAEGAAKNEAVDAEAETEEDKPTTRRPRRRVQRGGGYVNRWQT